MLGAATSEVLSAGPPKKSPMQSQSSQFGAETRETASAEPETSLTQSQSSQYLLGSQVAAAIGGMMSAAAFFGIVFVIAHKKRDQDGQPMEEVLLEADAIPQTEPILQREPILE